EAGVGPARGAAGRSGRGRAADRARGRGAALRPLPRPRDVSHPRQPWPGHRLRWASDEPRRPGQISERAGDVAVSQGRDPLRFAGGAADHGGREPGRAGDHRRRGLYGRHRLSPGGAAGCVADGHGPDRRADGGALARVVRAGAEL
uniref:Transcriptional regulator, MarR family n=1 Tax=Parastrongyloides trichosuri TaxID=131310 RepID=A0A0N5A117_PARTI